MLRWFRTRLVPYRAVACVLLLAMGAWAQGHGLAGSDEHVLRLVVHDEAAHAFSTGSTTVPQGADMHCVLCHLIRTVRVPTVVATVKPLAYVRQFAWRGPAARAMSAFPAAEPPLRSPPVSL
jgi:hypothetical protein